MNQHLIDNWDDIKKPGRDDDVEGFLWQTWQVFLDTAEQTPHDHPGHDKLVQVIIELTKLPSRKVHKESTLWSDLPILGPSLREAWIAPEVRAEKIPSEAATKWIRLNSFTARLSDAGFLKNSLFGLWSILLALEDTGLSRSGLECSVAAAAEWIVHAQRVLLENGARMDATGEEDRPMLAGRLCDGPSRFSSHRWEFWRRRFGEVGGVARDCVVRMVRAG
ncbi:hypothetical protein BO71DRAFT_383082 [Aspergillus ellipticus CBS 707.79]|uniref:Uncharacterized protein n=1 Tax=Aspergillus ellipticus CBS 707.79 TaxID=1448320 RepID=A0A319D5H6_9EURO|nr:hypothetical protein BO71DRAFT_383082 [Aspergillus ellipticus CBS 707.79]